MQSLEASNLCIIRQTHGKLPPLPYQKVKEAIMGKKYQLDLSFISTDTSTHLHEIYKKKSGPANTLAFPYDTTSGEILMHLETIRRQASVYARTYHQHLLFLFIHSMLHLKGYVHGNDMEVEEEKFYQKFKNLV
ncbi:rRNA maturation RNase YbeY [Candidatus Nomurabacteria bacterium]|nr:rRNA maturation RNase YbeY [Candidatus Nomurabacteria bacterium]